MQKSLSLLLLFLCFFGKMTSQTIGGKIIDAVSGEGVANSLITVDSSSETFLTDSKGDFRIQVSSFPVTIHIKAPGYRQTSATFTGSQLDRIISINLTTEALSEVVVRSTIIPENLLETPASVNILTSEDLARSDETNFVEALNTVPGVYVHQGALNTNKMSIRGIGARSQYSTNRIKAYFEGIPISSAEGETTLDDLDPNIIERVEVIKGPNSSTYGAGLGGVINLFAGTENPAGTEATVQSTFGSFGLWKKTIKASHVSERSNWFAAYNHLSTDSFRENGAYDRKSITLHGRIMGDSLSNLSLLANFTKLKAFIPSSINREQLENEPTAAAYTWGASRGYESYDKGLLGMTYFHRFSEDLDNTTSVYMNFRDAYEPRPFDILKEDQIAAGARTKFNFRTSTFGLASEYSIGAEYYNEWYDSATFENLYEDFPGQGSVAGAHLSDNSQLRNYYNIFGQWNLDLTQKLKLQAGVNLNRTSYSLTDLYADDNIDQTGDYDFESIISPRLGAVFNLSPGKSLYASISHGFSTPSVAETLTPEGLINVNLEPETGVNYELGFKGNWLENRLYSQVSLYSVQVENLLVAERVGQDQYIGRNAGKTNHNGMEVFLKYFLELSPQITLRPYLNAAFNFFEFEEFVDLENDFSGNSLPGVPERTINAGINLHTDAGLQIFTSFQHVGEIPLNDENSLYNDAYNVVDLKASYTHSFSRLLDLELFAGVNNVFDEKYASSILPNAVGFGGSAPRYYYPGRPRNYFGGVAVSFNISR